MLGLTLQKWGGVGVPVNSADLVLQPLRAVTGDRVTTAALAAWDAMPAAQQTSSRDGVRRRPRQGAGRRPRPGRPGRLRPGPGADRSPSCGWRSRAASRARSRRAGTFYGGDQTRTMLLLSDGAYLEDTARAPTTSAVTSGG